MSAAILNTLATVTAPSPAPLPAITLNDRLSFVSLTPENIDILKRLNSEIFPVSYPDTYYAVVVRPELDRFCKLSKKFLAVLNPPKLTGVRSLPGGGPSRPGNIQSETI